jgi:hypothetical protein
MDLNDLFHRHGVSLLMAQHAACDRSRSAHRAIAAACATRIARQLQRAPLAPA